MPTINLTTIRLVATAAGFALAAVTTPASASLTLIDDPVFGPQSLVWDTASGLEWLRLNFTGGGPGHQSATIAELNPGQEFAGFRVASAGDWAGLMGEVGFPGMPGAGGCFAAWLCSVDPTAEANFTTLFDIYRWEEIGYAYSAPPPQVSFDSAWFLPAGTMLYNGFGEGCVDGGCDLALVRDDPPAPASEPGSLTMLVMALAFWGLVSLNSRRIRQRGLG